MADASPGDGLTDEILAAAVNGDEAAFTAVYRDLQPRLRRYATALVGQDADDVTAEAWLQIARDIRRFRGDADAFRGWTTRIVRNRALDAARARGRRRTDPTDATEILDAVARDDPAADALQRLSTAAAIELIASLPREQADAVLLRAVIGLDAKTAGEVLDKSATAVRVAAHRGLKALGRRLADDARRPPAKRNPDERR